VDQNVILKNDVGYGAAAGEVSPCVDSQAAAVTVGQQLFKARMALRESDMKKISADLCIRPHLLVALERDDFNKFPSACYAAGFLKNYAAYLGLNVAQIVARYKKDFTGSTKKVDLVFLGVEKKHNHRQQMIISLIILTALVIYGVWFSMKGSDRLLVSSLPDVSAVTSSILAKVSSDEQKSPAKYSKTPVRASAVPVAVKIAAVQKKAPEKAQGFDLVQKVNAAPVESPAGSLNFIRNKVRLSVSKDTWIRIMDKDSKILVDRVLLAGEQFSLTDRKGLTLMTSDAGAVSILVGDRVVSSLGGPGQVRSGISLDQDNLLMNGVQASR